MTINEIEVNQNLKLNNGHFPEKYIVLGVIVGFILVTLGTSTLFFLDKAPVASMLTICVGFGIILAALGTQVSGRWAGWSATGAGATAVMLFLVLQNYTQLPNTEFIKGNLEGDFSKVADIRIIDDDPMYVYRDKSTSTIKFLILGRTLKSKWLRLQVDTIEKETGREYFQLIASSDLITKNFLQDKTKNTIQLTFDYNNKKVLHGSDVIFAERDSIIASQENALIHKDWNFGFRAFANEDTPKLDEPKVKLLITDLTSPEVYVRRNARENLATGGPTSVPLMAKAFRDAENTEKSYRTRVGVTYALSEMLRSKPELRSEVSKHLQNEDFSSLVAATSDPDKTIRYQAAEFLYLLADERSVSHVVDAAKSGSPDGLNNQIIILQKSGDMLSAEQKSSISDDLRRNNVAPVDTINNLLNW